MSENFLDDLNENLKWYDFKAKQIQKLFFKTKNYKAKYKITPKQAKSIEKWIKQENQDCDKDHMIEKNYKQILKDSQTWCVWAFIDNKLVGYISLMSVGIVYELGSLIIKDNHRGRGLGSSLTKEILTKYGDRPVYLVTNIKAVEAIVSKYNMKKYTKQDLPSKLINIIEKPWSLLDDDIVFVNQILKSQYL